MHQCAMDIWIMIRYKITTKYGEYRSIGQSDDKRKDMVKFAKSMVQHGSYFEMTIEDDITFIIGQKLLEDCQFQIEHYE